VKRVATLFSGGELAGIGIHQAGYELAWGLELLPEIAAVAMHNLGHNVYVGSILDYDPHNFPAVDGLHASPPCPSFSVANHGGVETELDKALAHATAWFIRVLKPEFVTIENVTAYRKSESYAKILGALEDMGYFVDARNYLASNYGVPQSRRRLIVRASRGLFREVGRKPGGGWYAAVEDLLPGCPDDELADWQIKAIERDGGVLGSLLVESRNSHTVSQARVTRPQHEGAWVVAGETHMPRAVLVQSKNANKQSGAPISRDQDTPAFVTMTNHPPRVVLIDGNNADPNGTISTREATESALTITSARSSALPRAVVDGVRTVQLTPRCLARFQTVPDWYELPEKRALAIKILGNGVPCELMRRVWVSF